MFTRLRCPTNPFRPGIRGVRSSFPASLTARGPQRRRPNDWSSWSGTFRFGKRVNRGISDPSWFIYAPKPVITLPASPFTLTEG